MQREITFGNDFEGDRVVYHRQDLHSTSREVATSIEGRGAPAILKLACAVTSCDPHAGVVTLQNGNVMEADMIVGADSM